MPSGEAVGTACILSLARVLVPGPAGSGSSQGLHMVLNTAGGLAA